MVDFKEGVKTVLRGAKEAGEWVGGSVERVIFRKRPRVELNSLIRAYGRNRKKELNKELKREPDEEERKRRREELGAELKKRREQEVALQKFEADKRRELEGVLKTESDDEEYKENYRKELEEVFIEKRESQRAEDQQMTFIDGEERPVGFAQRKILEKRIGCITISGTFISDSEYLRRQEDREKTLNELYKEKSENVDTMSDQRKKEIESEIKSLKEEVEREILKVAAVLSTKSLKKVEDVIDDFTDPKTKQEMPLNGNYEPIDIKWSSNEARAWEKQVKEMLNYSLTRTATVLRNTKRVYEEAKFEKTPRKISIGPEKPSDKKMKKESVRIEYSEKKEWARLRIEEYAKSQKIILEILKRIGGTIRVSLKNDPEVRNLSTFLKRNPDMGQDWLKIKEAMQFQSDIKDSFRLEIGEQCNIQILKNTVKQDLQDILYRNFIDMFRGVVGPLVNMAKGGSRFIVGRGGALVSMKEISSLAWNFVSGGVEFFLKETLVSPTRLGIKLTVGGGGAIERRIRKNRKNKKIREKIDKGINT